MTHKPDASPQKRIDFDLKEDKLSDEPNTKQGRLYVVCAGIYISKLAKSNIIRQMPLDLDNGLPGVLLRIGSDNTTDTSFLCHIDSCAAMNTGNLLLHQYIITNYPHTVAEYTQYDDSEPFEPIRLECAVQAVKKIEEEHGKLTAIVRYFTPYTYADGSPVLLSFGLGAGVAVRSILGKPTLKAWNCVIDFGANKFIAHGIQRRFDIEYEEARQGLPDGVQFTREDFQRPIAETHQSSNIGAVNILEGITDGCDEVITPETEAISIKDDHSQGYLQRSINTNSL